MCILNFNLLEMNYFVYGYNKRKFGFVYNVVGIQYVGYEGYWIYVARCVYYVYYNGRKGGGLKYVIIYWIWIYINMYCGINDNNDNGNLIFIDFI